MVHRQMRQVNAALSAVAEFSEIYFDDTDKVTSRAALSALTKTFGSSPGRLCDALYLTAAVQVTRTGQPERHISPCPQLVHRPARSGAGQAAVKDAVVVQAEQLTGMEHKPRRGSGRPRRDFGPCSEMATVIGPWRGTIGKALMWVAAHGQTSTARTRRCRATATGRLTGAARPNPRRSMRFQLNLPQEPAERPPGGIAGDGIEQALAIHQEPLPARCGLAPTQHEHQIRVTVAELQVSIDVQLEINTAMATDGLSHRAEAGKTTRCCASGHGGRRPADEKAGSEDVSRAGKRPSSVGAVGGEDDRTIAGP
jgi:hypothetical protein